MSFTLLASIAPEEQQDLLSGPQSYTSIYVVSVVVITLLVLIIWIGGKDLIASKKALASTKRRLTMAELVMFSVPVTLLLSAIGVVQLTRPGGVWAANHEQPPWHQSSTPQSSSRFSEDVIRAACAEAKSIMTGSQFPTWTPHDAHRLSEFLGEELPHLVDQRSVCDGALREFIEAQDPALGVLAETYGPSSLPVCLYTETIQQTFRDRHIEDAQEQVTFLAYLLIHETFHLAARYGGVIPIEVRGDRDVQGNVEVSAEHVGLQMWIAEIARCQVQQEEQAGRLNSARHKISCLQVTLISELLEPTRLYGKWMSAQDWGGTQNAPLGPPLWGLVPKVEKCER